MKQDALLIIDMQTALIEQHPYNETIVVSNIKQLLRNCRKKGIPVIYVQHDGGAGDELEHGCTGWEIWKDITPLPEEKVFEKKYNSAFLKTGLREFLTELEVKNIILCGMQSEYCLDVSCKVAFEYGYCITIAKATTTTFDNDFASGKRLSEYYEDSIWDKRYARVISMEQIIEDLNN